MLKRVNTDILQLKEGANLIKCHNCGASIDVVEGRCKYCHTEVKYLQEWILDSDV